MENTKKEKEIRKMEKSVKEIETELDKEFSIMIDNLFK